MGLKKRVEFDHSRESVFEAAGYSDETVEEELEPRATLLANQLVRTVLTYPAMTIEVLLNSSVLRDKTLDSRDRAVIVMMTGRFLASAFVQHMSDPEQLRPDDGGTPGFVKLGSEEHHEVFDMSKVEWDTLVNHVQRRVFGEGRKKVSEHIERMQKVLDDLEPSPLQQAVVEVLVLRASTMDAQNPADPSSMASLLN